jgi:hypothetical protein
MGGKINGVPLSISWRKKFSLTINWIIKLLISKYKKIKIKDIFEILCLSLFNKGLIIQKKKLYYNIANKNRYLMKFFK